MSTGRVSWPASPSTGQAKGRGARASVLFWHPAHQIPPCLSFRELETSSPSPAPCAKPHSAGEWYRLGKNTVPKWGDREGPGEHRAPRRTGGNNTTPRELPAVVCKHAGTRHRLGTSQGERRSWHKAVAGFGSAPVPGEAPGSPHSPCARPGTSRPSTASGTSSPAGQKQAGRMLGGRRWKTPPALGAHRHPQPTLRLTHSSTLGPSWTTGTLSQ